MFGVHESASRLTAVRRRAKGTLLLAAPNGTLLSAAPNGTLLSAAPDSRDEAAAQLIAQRTGIIMGVWKLESVYIYHIAFYGTFPYLPDGVRAEPTECGMSRFPAAGTGFLVFGCELSMSSALLKVGCGIRQQEPSFALSCCRPAGALTTVAILELVVFLAKEMMKRRAATR